MLFQLLSNSYFVWLKSYSKLIEFSSTHVMASCRNDISVCPGKPLIINWSTSARNMQFPSGTTSCTSKLLSKANLRMDLLKTGRFLACSKPSPDKCGDVYNIMLSNNGTYHFWWTFWLLIYVKNIKKVPNFTQSMDDLFERWHFWTASQKLARTLAA